MFNFITSILDHWKKSKDSSFVEGVSKNPVTNHTTALPVPLPMFECKTCKRDEVDARANGCDSKYACPMEYVGHTKYNIPFSTYIDKPIDIAHSCSRCYECTQTARENGCDDSLCPLNVVRKSDRVVVNTNATILSVELKPKEADKVLIGDRYYSGKYKKARSL